MNAADVNALAASNLIPISQHDPALWDWQGNNGFKSSNIQNVNDDVGRTFWIPLFTPYDADPDNYQAGTGQGSNYNYNIVAMVPVKIMAPSNANRQIVVQPAVMADPNAVFKTGTVQPAGASWTYATVVLPPRLTK